MSTELVEQWICIQHNGPILGLLEARPTAIQESGKHHIRVKRKSHPSGNVNVVSGSVSADVPDVIDNDAELNNDLSESASNSNSSNEDNDDVDDWSSDDNSN